MWNKIFRLLMIILIVNYFNSILAQNQGGAAWARYNEGKKLYNEKGDFILAKSWFKKVPKAEDYKPDKMIEYNNYSTWIKKCDFMIAGINAVNAGNYYEAISNFNNANNAFKSNTDNQAKKHLEEIKQTTFEHVLDSATNNRIYSIIQTDDKGYLIAGVNESNDYYLVQLVKMDVFGRIKRNKKVISVSENAIIALVKCNQNSFILVSSTSILKNNGKKSIIVFSKIDNQLNVIQQDTLVDNLNSFDLGCLLLNSNKNVLTTIKLFDVNYGYITKVFMMTNNGKVLMDSVLTLPKNNTIFSVDQTIDGGYILAGYAYFPKKNAPDSLKENAELLIVKTDSNFKTQWFFDNEKYKPFLFNFRKSARCITSLKGGDFLISGTFDVKNSFLMKIDNKGNVIWFKSFSAGKSLYLNSIIESSDGEYFAAGSVIYEEKNKRCEKLYLVKVNEAGAKLWEKEFGQWETFVESTSINLIRTVEGGIAITYAYKNKYNSRIIKLDKNGNGIVSNK